MCKSNRTFVAKIIFWRHPSSLISSSCCFSDMLTLHCPNSGPYGRSVTPNWCITSNIIISVALENSFFVNVCCVMVFYLFLCGSVGWFLYGPFCHGALKLDISTLFTTFCLWTSLQFVLLVLFKHELEFLVHT